jgi:hypothetical protein
MTPNWPRAGGLSIEPLTRKVLCSQLPQWRGPRRILMDNPPTSFWPTCTQSTARTRSTRNLYLETRKTIRNRSADVHCTCHRAP